jgi:hypothetical protein
MQKVTTTILFVLLLAGCANSPRWWAGRSTYDGLVKRLGLLAQQTRLANGEIKAQWERGKEFVYTDFSTGKDVYVPIKWDLIFAKDGVLKSWSREPALPSMVDPKN